MRVCATLLLCLSGAWVLYGQDASGRDAGWRFSNRLQAGWETDSNVREELRDGLRSESTRFLFESKARRKWSRHSVQWAYRGGLQLYNKLSSEHKLIQEAEAGLHLPVTPTVQISTQLWGRVKLFLNQDADYAYGKGQISLSKRFPAGFAIKGGVNGEVLDYAQSSYYNFGGPGYYLQVQYDFNRHLHATAFFSGQGYTFKRQALSSGDVHYGLAAPGDRQKDLLNSTGGRLDISWSGFLAQAGYRFEQNESNSFAHDYSRHVVDIMVVKTFAGLYFRALGTLQKKSYPGDLVPFWPLQLDTEREENNYLVLDVSRALTPAFDLLLRAAWYRNESIWADLYYKKTLFTLSGELHF